MKTLILLSLVFVTIQARSLMCDQLYKARGLSKNFNETIAHAIHSMNVHGLQMFNPRADDINSIPTVNLDRSSDVKVLPFAPNYPLGNDFFTESMNMIDRILGEIGNEKDGLGPNWSPVERIAHAFHMRDLWHRIKVVYDKQTLPSDDLCVCLIDTRANGIYQAVQWVSDHYDSGTPITLLNRPIPKLVDADAWATWKDRLLHYYTDDALSDAASYLYCATKDS